MAKPKPSERKRSKSTATGVKTTKLYLLIELLKRKSGATIDQAAKVTGWQAHSVCGAISGVLKKKRGLTIQSASDPKYGRIYRIVGET